MADQDKSDDQKKPTGRTANLGQKEAQQQQHSKSELGQMGEQSGQAERDQGKRQSE
jgi:hypothetical protein